MNITEINQKKLSSLDTSELKAMHDIFKGVSNPNAKKITKDLEAELKNRKTESYKLKEGRISKICSIVLGENFCPNFIYEDIDFTKPSEIKEAYEIFEASADWIIYDRKTGKQLSPSKSWRKWQGAKMAAAKIGGDAEVSDKAWYHDNKAKLMGEATDLEEASATVQSVLKALRLKGGKDADTLIKKMRDLGLESKVSKAHADAAKKILKGQITKFVKESEDLEEAIKWWTVTITKKAGKLFKGQTVDVKASNSAQAIKKGIKQMKGDPITVPSGSVDAVLGEGTSHNFARKHNT